LKSRIAIAVIVIAFIALVGWRFTANQQKEAAQTVGGPGGARSGGGGGGGGGRGDRPSPVEVAVAGPATIEQRLQAVGTAVSPLRVELSPRVSGRIESLTVREGDLVTKGQILVTLDPRELQQRIVEREATVAEARSRLAQAQLGEGPNAAGIRGAVIQAQAAVESALANLGQLQQNYDAQVAAANASVTEQQARVDAAEAQVANAEAALEREKASRENLIARRDRLQALFEKGYVAGQELDNARTAANVQAKQVDVAAAQLNAAKSAVNSAKATLKAAENQASIVRRRGTADIEAGKARVTQARADLQVARAGRVNTSAYQENLRALRASLAAAESQLDQARTQSGETALRSSIDGVVTARNADPGALASPGAPVLVIQALDSMFVVASVPLEECRQIRVGQEAQIRFDALPGRTIRASVASVNPAADLASRQIEVRLRLPNPDRAIKPGMFAQVGFVTRRVEAAVTVPAEAVKTVEGRPTVTWVDDEGTAHQQPVSLGERSDERVEIVEGLQPGQRVITLTYSPVPEGGKVQLPEPKGAREGRKP
jgi:RND family efflux transporter MFP subunit